MAKAKKEAVEPKEEVSLESTESSETPESANNADIRALAEESLIDAEPITDEETEESEESSEPEEESLTTEDAEDEQTESDNAEESDLLEDLIEPSEENKDELEELVGDKKSGEQKRIDKLTASNYELKDELTKLKDANAALKANKVEPTEEATAEYEGKKYTLPQLEKALANAIEEGDAPLQAKVQSLMQDVKINKSKAAEKRKQEFETQQIEQGNKEAQLILNAYSVWHGPNATEIYPGSTADLDLNNKESIFRRLAAHLYENDSQYHVLGGRIASFSDAFKKILKANQGKPVKTKNEKALETKVTKLKKKTSSVPGSNTVKKEKSKSTPKPKSDYEKVKEEQNLRNTNKV